MGNNPRAILRFTHPYRVYFREMNFRRTCPELHILYNVVCVKKAANKVNGLYDTNPIL